MMWISDTPCARTTVGSSSAAYCSPMLYEMLTLKRPMMASDADTRPAQSKGHTLTSDVSRGR